ncbi:MAG: tRNA (adenosine(37)-N6)-threonylcarbamoyltransferase complex transferase subunit TsaD [Spirochaetes bacterium]|nr:tRNA (adenosine(37)-N6)-threonylcarbamoyltransferase complex transferase subunit TsaD [Spirochaetota bacterium]
MFVLGIETSCDETSIGIVRDGKKILANIVLSQTEFHEKFHGVVPEIASRVHLTVINRLLEQALKQSKLKLDQIDCISVVNQPGLVGSLMVGVSFAKSLSLSLHKPLVSVNHLLAHLYANFLKNKAKFPYIGLLVSGGHTLLVMARNLFDYRVIGTTLDDAAGEAYDKVSKLMGLGYPGGPIIDQIARNYKGQDYIRFSSGLSKDPHNRFNFSYSGLKTAVLNFIKKNPDFDKARVAKGFQIAAISVLTDKTMDLAKKMNIKNICIAGGVAANSYLRELFLKESKEKRYTIYIPEMDLCTDNGAMVAGFAYHKAKKGDFDNLEMDVYSRPKGGPISYLKNGL